MKEFVGALEVRLANGRPELDSGWVVTPDRRLWKYGTYVGMLRGYVILSRGVELDYEPRPIPSRHPRCTCNADQDYSPTCPVHPMPTSRRG